MHAAGCEKVFIEHDSGTLAKRPERAEALGYLRKGDTLDIGPDSVIARLCKGPCQPRCPSVPCMDRTYVEVEMARVAAQNGLSSRACLSSR